MKYQASLSKSKEGQIKSKVVSTELCQIVLDLTMTPRQYANFVSKFFDDEFTIEIKEIK